jgi:uncharacterized membrane protein
MTETATTPQQRSRRRAMSFRETYIADEQRFRHEMGRSAILLARRAQVFAFFLSGLFLTAGTAVILLGHDIAGAAIAATASVSLATAFLVGNRVHASQNAATQETPSRGVAADQQPAEAM